MDILIYIIALIAEAVVFGAIIITSKKRFNRQLLAAEEQGKANTIRETRDLRAQLERSKSREAVAQRELEDARTAHRNAKQSAFDSIYSTAQAKIAEPLKNLGSKTGRLSGSSPSRSQSRANHPSAYRSTPSAAQVSNHYHHDNTSNNAFVNGVFLGAVLADGLDNDNPNVQQDVIVSEPAPAPETRSYTEPVYDNSPSYSAPEPSYDSSPSYSSFDSGSSGSFDSGSSFSGGGDF